MLLQLLPAILFLSPLALADPNPDPQAVAAGGGLAATTLAATQQAVVTTAGSLITQGGTTTATWIAFTQTFASTALGTWDLGATPLVGSIGLGTIQGTVGNVKTKRGLEAIQTPAP